VEMKIRLRCKRYNVNNKLSHMYTDHEAISAFDSLTAALRGPERTTCSEDRSPPAERGSEKFQENEKDQKILKNKKLDLRKVLKGTLISLSLSLFSSPSLSLSLPLSP